MMVQCIGFMLLASISGGALWAPESKDFDPKQAEWRRNTFPGPGHRANPGPWGDYQGSDRCEWISDFGVHPKNAQFILQMTDLGRLVYTNTRLGGVEFIPADMPASHGACIAFHPHDPQTAYALMQSQDSPGWGGWWRTQDEGESWHLLFAIPTSRVLGEAYNPPFTRGQKNLLCVNPAENKSSQLFIGTSDQGILRSVDDGKTWAPFAMRKRSIHELHISADGRWLYAIEGPQAYAFAGRIPRGEEGGRLYRIDLQAARPKAEALGRKQDRVWSVSPHPNNGDTGVLIAGRALIPFRDGGRRWLKPVLQTKNPLIWAGINPANPNHWVAQVAEQAVSGIRFSTDAGQTWQTQNKRPDGSINMIDYAPANHLGPGYRYLQAQLYVQDRGLVAFVPNDPAAVLSWSTNFLKGPQRSDDYGASFAPFAHGGSFKRVGQVAIGADDAHVAMAVTEYGIRITADGGRSWRGYSEYNAPTLNHRPHTQNTFLERSSWGVAISPRNPRTLIATHSHGPVAIKRSDDAGATWKTVGTYSNESYGSGNLVFWSQDKPKIVYAGFMRSNDGGKSFATQLEHSVSLVSPHDARVVLSKESASAWFLSLDAGDNWIQLANPPGARKGRTRTVQGVAHEGVAFDPRPAHDVSRGRPLRLLCGGEEGVWEYLAPVGKPAEGRWQRIPMTLRADPWQQSTGNGQWVAWVAFDPRPGYHHRVYAFPGRQSTARGRGQLWYQQAYYSNDSGKTWASLYDVAGELPNFLSVQTLNVSAQSGDVIIQDYTGQYRLVHLRGSAGSAP